MTEIETLSSPERRLHSRLHDIIFRWLKYVTKTLGKVGINDIVYDTLWDESHNIASYIAFNDPPFSYLSSADSSIIFKMNHFALTIIIGKNRKYKVTIGINSKIAKNNIIKALSYWPDNPSLKTTNMITGNNFFVECSDIIQGLNYKSFFYKNNRDDPIIDQLDFDIVKTTSANSIFNFFAEYIANEINSSDGEYIYYSNDMQVSNFLLLDSDKSPYLINFDFDFITKSTIDVFIENACKSFFYDIYNVDADSLNLYTENWKNHAVAHTLDQSKDILKQRIYRELHKQ